MFRVFSHLLSFVSLSNSLTLSVPDEDYKVMFLSLALGHLRGNGVVLCENISLSSVSDIYHLTYSP